MSLGSVFNFLKKKSSPSVPPLDSKSQEIPKPNNPFGSGGSQSNNESGNDLPDFPDFPGMDSKIPVPDNSEPGVGIEPPSMQNINKDLGAVSKDPVPAGMSNSDSATVNTSDNDVAYSLPKINNSSEEKKESKQSNYLDNIDEELSKYVASQEKLVGTPSVVTESSDHFINIFDYKQVLDYLDRFKENLSEFDNTLLKLNDLNNNSASREEEFKKSIEDIQRKLIFVDKTLFESPAE